MGTDFVVESIMPKEVRGSGKKRGRPKTTGPGIQISMRWQPPVIDRIDDWRKQHGAASRGEAIRRLVEAGLGAALSRAGPAGEEPAPSSMTRERAAFLKAARDG